jgi:hypothetical protein
MNTVWFLVNRTDPPYRAKNDCNIILLDAKESFGFAWTRAIEKQTLTWTAETGLLSELQGGRRTAMSCCRAGCSYKVFSYTFFNFSHF